MWDKPPSLFADLVAADATEVVKDASSDFLNGLVEKMPVDTSRAVSNVIVSVNEPDYSVDENKYIGREGARAAGQRVIDSIGDKDMPTVYVQDNLYYVQYLEKGHSRQAINGVFLPTFLGIAMWYR